MTHTWKSVIAMCAIAAAPVLAQTGQTGQSQSPAPGRGQTGSAKAAQANDKKNAGPDMAFVKEAAIGGMAEVELGKMATEKAANADVKQFGQRMVADHSKANDELKQWAAQKSITLPTELDAKHKALRDKLAKLSGEAFDRAYMHEMLLDHQHDVNAFKREASAGKDADLKAWAAKTLPTLQEHLKLAQGAATKVGASKGRGQGRGPGGDEAPKKN